ncbi:MAG: hypothetical protein SFY81_05530 [Verrucomicrobiota bacterium]|nr:hypothetical protein [Verrucomicrobiota bacterium]
MNWLRPGMMRLQCKADVLPECEMRGLIIAAVLAGLMAATPLFRIGEQKPGEPAARFNWNPFGKKQAEQVVSHGDTEADQLLNQWWVEGTAAGNIGDQYDNRDREHSPFDLKRFPQFKKITYSEAERNQRQDWSLAKKVRPGVVIGNASTSGSVFKGGSNTRQYYMSAEGMNLLHEQYRGNNLYFYPEHNDHDPISHGGYGDLLPANSPYLITAQGSSGSDQPFMIAIAQALGAFRPEVKKALVTNGMLMPTVQMLFRRTAKGIDSTEDYLSGKAHPTVFEASSLDATALVRAAHAIQFNAFPPMIGLKVIEEDQPIHGVDFFDRRQDEIICDTPQSIARIFRARHRTHRMVVSAGGSRDAHGKPLTFHWKVLRGNREKIRINPLDGESRTVELAFDFDPEQRSASGIESPRVEVGAFAHNGSYYSAPGFISVFHIASERRTFDKAGRLLEIGYGAGQSKLVVTNWSALFFLLKEGQATAKGRLISTLLGKDAVAEILSARNEHTAQSAEVERTEQTLQTLKKGGAGESTVQAAELEQRKAAESFELLMRNPRYLFGQRLGVALQDPRLVEVYGREIREGTIEAQVEEERLNRVLEEYVNWGVLSTASLLNPGIRSAIQPVNGKGFSNFEANLLMKLNGEVMGHLLRGIARHEFVPAYVDSTLSVPKLWRDLYQYDDNGELLGWVRLGPSGRTEYSALGQLVLERDGSGKPTRSQSVRYQLVNGMLKATARVEGAGLN